MGGNAKAKTQRNINLLQHISFVVYMPGNLFDREFVNEKQSGNKILST